MDRMMTPNAVRPIAVAETADAEGAPARLSRPPPDPCGGRPCIRGMRIRVKDVLDMLAGGASKEEILEDFPYLEASQRNTLNRDK
jgi:hypothetical protein